MSRNADEAELGNLDEAKRRLAQSGQYQHMTNEVLQKHTKVRFGRSVGAANAGLDATTARIISDQQDNTGRNAIILTTAGLGLAKSILTIMDEAKIANMNADEVVRLSNYYNQKMNSIDMQIQKIKQTGGTVDPDEIRKAIMAELGTQANAGEMTNIHNFGTVSHFDAGYVQADENVNKAIETAVSNLSSEDLTKLSTSDLVRRIANEITTTGTGNS